MATGEWKEKMDRELREAYRHIVYLAGLRIGQDYTDVLNRMVDTDNDWLYRLLHATMDFAYERAPQQHRVGEGPRVPCPLCNAQTHALGGFLLPGGLDGHLSGRGDGCFVMKAAKQLRCAHEDDVREAAEKK